jgi:hypothetical protein
MSLDQKSVKGLRSGPKSPYADKIEALYKDNPTITAPEIVALVGCSKPIALKWLARVRPLTPADQAETVNVNAVHITEESEG